MGVAVGKGGQAHLVNEAPRPLLAFLPAHSLHLQSEGHIVQHCHPGEEAMFLEYQGAAELPAGRLRSEGDLTRSGLQQPGEELEQRCLAASAMG